MDDGNGEAVWVVHDDKKLFCYQTQEINRKKGTYSFLDIAGGGNQKLWFLEQRDYLALDTFFRQKVEHHHSISIQLEFFIWSSAQHHAGGLEETKRKPN